MVDRFYTKHHWHENEDDQKKEKCELILSYLIADWNVPSHKIVLGVNLAPAKEHDDHNVDNAWHSLVFDVPVYRVKNIDTVEPLGNN